MQQVAAVKQTNSQPKVPAPEQLPELPEHYQEGVEASVRYHSTAYNKLMADCDKLRAQVFDLECKLGAAKEVIEAKESQSNEDKSLVEVMRLERDRAVATTERVKTVCGAMLAILRAYETENEPLIVPFKGDSDEITQD